MSDSYTEVTSQSWFSRLLGSIKSVLVGLAMFVASFPVLYWNEGRAVRTAKSLEEGAGAVVSVASDRVDSANEGKLVHTTGQAATEETLADPEFNVSAQALKLFRTTEMYQWAEEKKSETRKKLGGGEETVTTYDYEKKWSDDLIDSSDFKKPEGHENPGSMPFGNQSFTAAKVTVGAFTLAEAQLDQITSSQDLRVDEAALGALPPAVKARAKLDGGRFYVGENAGSPAIGDVRVGFRVVKPGPVSLVARQIRDTFEGYKAQAGDTILLVDEGTHSADEMFKAAQSANVMLTWILRGVGFFVMFIGLTMVFRPISVFGDVIPFVGSLLGAGLGIFAFFVAVALSTVTIAIAWIAARPLLGILLLLVAVGAIVGLVMLARSRRAAKAAA